MALIITDKDQTQIKQEKSWNNLMINLIICKLGFRALYNYKKAIVR
ncbi:hypothetical protein XIS1_890096 [Xenorhabdus innexi]|uniref:Uncharacterized protein n=1 Tax=Xenorhabdus innexi TaxID=290109 RepID=A0A1N6N1G7_9GAMM|nr:hypothetical protein XIS1_890096 [Xenorhabdus innexi]